MGAIKNEEVLRVAGYVFNSYKRDVKDFKAFSTLFNDPFTAEFEAKFNELKELVEPQALTSELKKVTASLNEALSHMLELASRLDAFIGFAGRESLPKPGAFNLQFVRKYLHAHNVDAFYKAVSVTISEIEAHKAELTKGGMPATFGNEIAQQKDKIFKLNQDRQAKLSERKQLVVTNIAKIEEMITLISKINKFGKLIYKKSNPEKVDDYTIASLIQQAQQQARAESKKA